MSSLSGPCHNSEYVQRGYLCLDPGQAVLRGQMRVPHPGTRVTARQRLAGMRRGNGILIAQIKCGGARAQRQVICEEQKQGLSSMQRVPTGSVAQPEKQESEEECDHCAGSSANSSHPRGPCKAGTGLFMSCSLRPKGPLPSPCGLGSFK